MSTNFYLMWLHLQVVGGSSKKREREIKSYSWLPVPRCHNSR